jgi:perosamine synthetase
MMDNKLAMDGGCPVRTTEFRSRPFITEEMIDKVSSLVREGRFSKFIGSPVPGTKEIIGLKSSLVEDIIESVSFLGGPSVRKLESKWSRYHSVDYSIAVNSATSGLTCAIMALDIGPGDEIICSPFSFTASATSIILANAIPVFADIDLDTFCLSPESALNSVSESTKGIMAIHWNSNAGDLDGIISVAKSKELKVIEDASQSPLMVYRNKYLGTHGDVGVFSLNEPKNIMTGEGGIIVTNDSAVAVKCRLIRNHGEAIPDRTSTDDFVANAIGYNFRLVELLAEIGVGQLEHLPYLNKIRSENYAYLMDQLVDKFGEFIIPQKITHLESYFPYTAGFRWMSGKSKIHRDVVAQVLRSEGVPVASGVSRLMSDNPLFERQLAYGRNHCPFACHLYKGRGKYSIPELSNAKRLQNEEYLGFFQIGWPNTPQDMDDIVRAFGKIMANRGRLANNSSIVRESVFVPGR